MALSIPTIVVPFSSVIKRATAENVNVNGNASYEIVNRKTPVSMARETEQRYGTSLQDLFTSHVLELPINPIHTSHTTVIIDSQPDHLSENLYLYYNTVHTEVNDISFVQHLVEKCLSEKMQEYIDDDDLDNDTRSKLEEILSPLVAKIVHRIMYEKEGSISVQYDDVYDQNSVLSELSTDRMQKCIRKKVNVSNFGSDIESGAMILSTVTNGSLLFVSGHFSGNGLRNIACWDGSRWNNMSGGINNVGTCMALADDQIYVGGIFSLAGEVAVSNIACYAWETKTWEALPRDFNSECHALVWSSDTQKLYVGGSFTKIGEDEIHFLTEYDPATKVWSAFESQLNGPCRCICLDSEQQCLYIGGLFTGVENRALSHIAKYDLQTQVWTAIPGLHGYCNAIWLEGTDLYVGGSFTSVQNETFLEAHNIARFNLLTQLWEDMGNGVNGVVHSLRCYKHKLYIAGSFTHSIDGRPMSNLAEYEIDTNKWGADFGFQGTCKSLCAYNSLICGGTFSKVGDLTTNGLVNLRL